MDILKNDVKAILSGKINSKSARNGQFSSFPSETDTKSFLGELDPLVEENVARYQYAQVNSRQTFFIQKLEIIALRTSGKRLPGKKLAIYVGVVIAVLVLSYNLTKDLSFILISDKEGILNSICSISCS